MFFVQDIQPDGQRGKRGVNVGAHQVCQAEITFRPTQQHGAACIKVGHALAGVIVHGDHTAAVRCPLQRKVEQLGKQLTLVHFCTAEFGVLGQQLHPGVQVAGAVVAVHHGNRVACGGGNHINFGVNFAQGLFQHNHGKNAGAGADIAGAGRHAVGGGHAGSGVALRRAERNTGLQIAGGVQ